ncbi:hypothetical protein V494_04971 [Pseudogymnoascus sp. VKM F-4513 (FW-928)]|nr:hypothetical protein V494_04971 [Pseudogymnoascus sp. VKM F-4513 (FW-928)]
MLLLRGHVVALIGTILQLACCHHQSQELSSHKSASLPVQVYIIGSSRTGIAVVSTALQTLGYKQMQPGGPPISSADQAFSHGTFGILSEELEIEEHSIMSSGAKFIFPVDLDDTVAQIQYINGGEGFGGEHGFASLYRSNPRSIRGFFAQSDQEANLLELRITKNSDRVGDDWPKLCQFLGLGYSVVERYRLRKLT